MTSCTLWFLVPYPWSSTDHREDHFISTHNLNSRHELIDSIQRLKLTDLFPFSGNKLDTSSNSTTNRTALCGPINKGKFRTLIKFNLQSLNFSDVSVKILHFRLLTWISISFLLPKKDRGIQRVEAMLFALDKINRNESILPTIKLGKFPFSSTDLNFNFLNFSISLRLWITSCDSSVEIEA